jgi:hypothetical protein
MRMICSISAGREIIDFIFIRNEEPRIHVKALALLHYMT